MTSILIVDDSPVDRRLVTGLLAKNPDWELSTANNGKEALEAMEQTPFALVVSDLQMPELDGLELVSAAREKYPSVPVVLMTSEGSEEVAATALLRGAVSYVPKRMMGHILLDTVRSVLEVTGEKRNLSRVLGSLREIATEFELENDPDLLPPLISYLQELIVNIGVCNETEQMRVGIALNEALVNALYHGNLEVDSALREQENGEFYKVARQRSAEPPYQDRKLYLTARISPAKARFTVRDQGPGFDPKSLPDPTDPANLERISGRGILLMRTFMSEVSFNDTGNEVTMVMRGSDAGAPVATGA